MHLRGLEGTWDWEVETGRRFLHSLRFSSSINAIFQNWTKSLLYLEARTTNISSKLNMEPARWRRLPFSLYLSRATLPCQLHLMTSIAIKKSLQIQFFVKIYYQLGDDHYGDNDNDLSISQCDLALGLSSQKNTGLMSYWILFNASWTSLCFFYVRPISRWYWYFNSMENFFSCHNWKYFISVKLQRIYLSIMIAGVVYCEVHIFLLKTNAGKKLTEDVFHYR